MGVEHTWEIIQEYYLNILGKSYIKSCTYSEKLNLFSNINMWLTNEIIINYLFKVFNYLQKILDGK